jgi:MFS family permease
MAIARTLFERYFLGRRDLLLLWIGQIASGFGDSLASIGFLFLAVQLTGSERAVGTFQMVAYIPIIIFGLAAGVYVDRRDRRRVMLVADAGRAVGLALLPVAVATGSLTIAWAGATVVVITTLTAFFNPAYNSALPIIVDDPAKLFGVNAVMQSSRQFAAIAGPIFAAVGAGRSGPVALLSVNAVTYVISFICIALIGTKLATGERARIRLAELRGEAMLGLRSVMENRSIRTIFIITLANNFLLMGPAVVGTPLLVKKVFHGDLQDFALIELMYALGMTITGLVLHRFPAARRIGRLWAIGLLFDGLTFILYLFADSLVMLDIATFIHAIPIPLIIVSRATIIQRLVPRDLLGRAFGYIDIAVNGVLAISAGVTGIVASEIGPLMTIVYGGALAGVAGLVALALPSVTRVRFEEG